MNYLKGLIFKYQEQLKKDYYIISQLYDIKITRPMRLTIRQHIKIHGIFRILWKIICIILVKIPIWWPFLMVTYLWGLFLTYFFLPLIFWVEKQIEYKKNNLTIYFVNVDYNKVLYWILEIQWWLKTWIGLIHIFDLLYKWWWKLPRFVDFIYDKVRRWWYIIKTNSMRKDGAIDIWLHYLKTNQTRIKSNFYKYLWIIPRNFVFNWLNPHRYKIFRLVFYKNNRQRLYTWLYCRWLIRYKIFKGLVKYWVRGALHMGGRRLWLRTKYIYKMIILRCHIRYLYNNIVLKIRKAIYYISRELIYIWTTISLIIEIILIIISKLLPIFYFVVWLVSKILYVLIFILNAWYYNIFYSYEWYQIWFIKGGSNSIKALKNKKKVDLTAKKILSGVDIIKKKKIDTKNTYLTIKSRFKISLKNNTNKLWKLYFGPEAIFFRPFTSSDPNIDNINTDQNLKLKKPVKKIKNMNKEDIWTRMWKACCPPLWLAKPEDVNSPNSKYRVEFKAGIVNKKNSCKPKNN